MDDFVKQYDLGLLNVFRLGFVHRDVSVGNTYLVDATTTFNLLRCVRRRSNELWNNRNDYRENDKLVLQLDDNCIGMLADFDRAIPYTGGVCENTPLRRSVRIL